MFYPIFERLNERRDRAHELGGDAGFTLIELMVVLLILAILLAIAIPTFLGVTGSANDRAAQANLNTALTNAKSEATQNNQQYVNANATPAQTAAGQLAVLQGDEPSIQFVSDVTGANAGVIKTHGPISVWFDTTDGDGVVLAAYSTNGPACWYAVDNLTPLSNPGDIADGAYGNGALAANGSATQAPAGAGTWYSTATTTPEAGCDAGAALVGAVAWSNTGFPPPA